MTARPEPSVEEVAKVIARKVTQADLDYEQGQQELATEIYALFLRSRLQSQEAAVKVAARVFMLKCGFHPDGVKFAEEQNDWSWKRALDVAQAMTLALLSTKSET